ncbi:hypothetical protein IAG41_22290 [Sphingomonas sp. JC676]|uniref:hypothetical protein n=1 Tax=Sphingomonas sp. JC676 TaxID=2768065 RepID=UPI0016586E9D|nr:hypothetical protein [Sphingomonas sp. JC676]MBC9035128.1 hypothetical protein [Sphingomonas sp. JC676]
MRRTLNDRWLLVVVVAIAPTLNSCASAVSDVGTERYAASAPAYPKVSRTRPAGPNAERVIVDRFPGATVLSQVEFADTIVRKNFHYREVGSDIVVVSPGEYYSEDGRYSTGHRVVSVGTYSFERGLLSIDCIDCRPSFLGLGRQRVLFRQDGKLLMANADGRGGTIEMIPSP